MTHPTVTVYIQPLTQPRSEWCEACLLPSVIAFELVASTEHRAGHHRRRHHPALHGLRAGDVT